MSDDLIKRSDAIKAVLGITMYEARVPIDTVIYNIKDIPSADRPQGEWERIPYSFVGGYRCSICGQKSLENHWNYCPSCGARMKGADDDR